MAGGIVVEGTCVDRDFPRWLFPTWHHGVTIEAMKFDIESFLRGLT